MTTKTLRRRFFSLARRLIRSARRLTLHLPERWPWAEKFSRALARRQAIPSPACRHPSATDPPANRTSPQTRASPVCECPLLRPIPPSRPARRLQTAFKIPSGDCGRSRLTVLLGCRPDNRARSPQPLRSVAVSPSFGGFGFTSKYIPHRASAVPICCTITAPVP